MEVDHSEVGTMSCHWCCSTENSKFSETTNGPNVGMARQRSVLKIAITSDSD